MITFDFNIRNPWSHRFQNLWSRHGTLPVPHKHWELEILREPVMVQLMLNVTHGQDHAGLELALGLLGYQIHFMIYDHRHWDHEKNQWH